LVGLKGRRVVNLKSRTVDHRWNRTIFHWIGSQVGAEVDLDVVSESKDQSADDK